MIFAAELAKVFTASTGRRLEPFILCRYYCTTNGHDNAKGRRAIGARSAHRCRSNCIFRVKRRRCLAESMYLTPRWRSLRINHTVIFLFLLFVVSYMGLYGRIVRFMLAARPVN